MYYCSFPLHRAIHVGKNIFYKKKYSIDKYFLWKNIFYGKISSMEKNSMKLFHNPLLIFTLIPKPLMSVVSKTLLSWVMVRHFPRRLSWLLP